MISEMRRFLAVASACGLSASMVFYVASYAGTTIGGISPWAVVLSLGIAVLVLSMYAAEYRAFNNRTFFWTEFARGMPKWVVPCIKVLGVFFIVHFALFLVRSHAAAPEIQNGHYVLNNHGQIMKVLTRTEYFSLKSAELRFLAAGWIFFYFVPTAYWWFPRSGTGEPGRGAARRVSSGQ